MSATTTSAIGLGKKMDQRTRPKVKRIPATEVIFGFSGWGRIGFLGL
jgi:hypothetical protein